MTDREHLTNELVEWDGGYVRVHSLTSSLRTLTVKIRRDPQVEVLEIYCVGPDFFGGAFAYGDCRLRVEYDESAVKWVLSDESKGFKICCAAIDIRRSADL